MISVISNEEIEQELETLFDICLSSQTISSKIVALVAMLRYSEEYFEKKVQGRVLRLLSTINCTGIQNNINMFVRKCDPKLFHYYLPIQQEEIYSLIVKLSEMKEGILK